MPTYRFYNSKTKTEFEDYMSISDMAETIRPALVGLLVQKICPINKELSVITLAPDMEQIIIYISRE